MRKRFSLNVELRVLRTLALEPDSRAAHDLLAKLDISHFASEIGKAAFKRCLLKLKRSSTLPSWEELSSDPNIDETIQEALDECELEPLVSKKRTRAAIDRLNEYKKIRTLFKIGKQLDGALNSTEPLNVDAEIERVTNILGETKSVNNVKILRMGVNSNVENSVKRMLRGTAISLIPTGFEGFDSINKGIPVGSVMVVGAPTGRGKSLLLNQICENFAMSGAKVDLAPLEMSNDEMLQRNMARIGDFDMIKLLDPQNRISRRESKEIFEKFMSFDKKLARRGGSMEFLEFEEGINIEGLTSTVKPFAPDVLGIDYLGLLDGVGGDNQWQHMMDAVRYLHVWGKGNKCSSVVAVQMTDEGLLRYSKGVAEHAKFFWYWTVDEIEKQTGIYTITQRKARNASDHSFMLKFDFPRMRVTDASKDDIKDMSDRRKEGRRGNSGESTEKKWKKDSSLSWGESDEDEPQPKSGKRAFDHNKKKKDDRGGKKRPSKKDIEL